MNKIRTGKTKSTLKHLGKGVGSSRKRNLKKIANKQLRQQAKKELN